VVKGWRSFGESTKALLHNHIKQLILFQIILCQLIQNLFTGSLEREASNDLSVAKGGGGNYPLSYQD
jgi:hypothetical protein